MTRGNNFDALRLLGALAVLVSHQAVIMGIREPRLFGTYTPGYVAVFMFFAISGFLVAGSWQSDPNARRYLARRMLRLGPAYMTLMGVSLIVGTYLGMRVFQGNPIDVFNGSLWTIEYEVLCYLTLAVGASILPLRWGALIAFVALLFYWKVSTPRFGPELGLMFCAGVMLRTVSLTKTVLLGALLLSATLLFLGYRFHALVALIPALAVYVGNASWPYVRRAGRFGDFSYGIYIYAFPIQQFGVKFLGADNPYLLMLAISLAVTFLCAFLSWHLVEAPSLVLKVGLKRQNPAAVAYASIRAADNSVPQKIALSEK